MAETRWAQMEQLVQDEALPTVAMTREDVWGWCRC